MKGISVKQAAEIVGGRLSGSGDAGRELMGLVIDSRNVQTGFAFAAMAGERVDGHDYVIRPLSSARRAAWLSATYPMLPAAL